MHISRLSMYRIVTKYLVLSYLLIYMLLCTLTLFPSLANYHDFVHTAYASEASSSGEDDNSDDDDNFNDTPYGGKREPSQPVLNDPNLKIELISEGLQLPTQMAFIGPNDILVLEKDTGMVKRIINGAILEEPILDVNVATAFERGLVGIAIAANDNDNDNAIMQRNSNIVYLYYT